jgi:hypothetical protein
LLNGLEGVTGVAEWGMSLFLVMKCSARFFDWIRMALGKELLNGEEQISSRYIQQVIDLF